MTREEIGLALDQERRGTVPDLWDRVALGPYELMRQGECVILCKGNTVVWSSPGKPTPRDADQRQQNFD